MKKKITLLFFIVLTVVSCWGWLIENEALSLPIGFGRTQGSLKYNEIISDNFYLYHDADSPSEACYTLLSLETARLIIEGWFGVKRSSPLIVNMSSVTYGASFANFLTDSIELQTLGMIHSSLAWHEYTHSLTYSRMQDWMGSAATILHLAWLPSWWLEGLAETVSMSVGSDIQKGTERYYALTDSWPSYEKLHRLYDSSYFSTAGYSISGSFVSYIIYRYNIDISKMTRDFYRRSMPWWWPYSLIPFVDSLPLDAVLKKYTGKNAKALYEEYKTWASSYWKKDRLHSYYLNHPTDSLAIDGSFIVKDGSFYPLLTKGGSSYEISLSLKDLQTLSEKKLSIKDYEKQRQKEQTQENNLKDESLYKSRPIDSSKNIRLISSDVQAYVKDNFNKEGFSHQTLYIKKSKKIKKIKIQGRIVSIYRSKQKLVWEENFKSRSKICFVSIKNIKKPTCQFEEEEPSRFSILGAFRDKNSISSYIFIKQVDQKINGYNKIKIHKFYPDSLKVQSVDFNYPEPVSLTENPADGSVYMIMGYRSGRVIAQFDQDLKCSKTYWGSDTFMSLEHIRGSEFVSKILLPTELKYLRVDLSADQFQIKNCSSIQDIYPKSLSLVTLALASKKDLSLLDAMRLEHSLLYENDTKTATDQEGLAKTQNENESDKQGSVSSSDDSFSNQSDKVVEGLDLKSVPYNWKGRLLFLLPWIGANDYQDYYQLGVVGVPLMDHLQNETVYLTALFGIHSLTPDLSLNISSSRFWPLLNMSLFRTLSWDGWDSLGRSSYMRETGVNFSSTFIIKHWLTMCTLGVNVSNLTRYIYADEHQQGAFVEPFINLVHFIKLSGFSASYSNSFYISSSKFGSKFDFNKWKTALNFEVDTHLVDSSFNLDIDYSRTRGSRPRGLEEYARAVKKFVPGSGDSVNNIYLPMAENQYLFAVQRGNNQVGIRPSLTIPVVDDLETLIKIFYVGRLDFTAFFSYTGAWYGSMSDISEVSMIRAHGYNLNLDFDVKGVNFSMGLGVGQIIGKNFEAFGTFGFSSFL